MFAVLRLSAAVVLLLLLLVAAPIRAQESEITMVVTNTERHGARLRAAPSFAAAVVRVIPEGTSVQVHGNAIEADSNSWRKVRDSEGNTGYVVADFLVPRSDLYTSATSASAPQPEMQQTGTPLIPQGCYDAQLRFPRADEPRRAVTFAIQDMGGNPYVKNPFMERMLNESPRIVGGWVATSLIRNRVGLPAGTLADWIQEGYSLSFGLRPLEWSAMTSWSADTCEGAFVQHPSNYSLMQLVRTLVR